MKKSFIAIANYSPSQIQGILDLALKLKNEHKSGRNAPLLKGKVLAMIFQKPSLRTRVSFDMAMRHLEGDALYISPDEIGLGKRETIADIARVLSGYVDGIMARVFDHKHILELNLWSGIPVINGLSDYNHPCQAISDALTILEYFSTVKGVNIAYIGDGNNVAVSLMHLFAKLGGNFAIASPEEYDLPKKAIDLAYQFAKESGGTLNFLRSPKDAVVGADIIYTDTWTSMGQEEETNIRENTFNNYQVNKKLVSSAKPDAIVMHCLPAHRGKEITDEIADGPQSVIFPQAHNRLHAQKAILVYLLS